jgi:hypothetical protein
MNSYSKPNTSLTLPLKRDLTLPYVLSLITAILMTAVSICGVLYPSTLYPANELLQTFVPNDVVNLLIGVPITLGSIWLTRRGRLIGLLFWPGALLYVIYNYIAYLIGIPFSWITFAYLALVLLSVFTLMGLLKNIEKNSVKTRLSGFVQEKIVGWVLIVFGFLFTIRAFYIVIQAIMSQTTLPSSEIGVLISDVVVSLLWITGGIFLLQRKPLGYVSGLGLLFAASMLFIALIVFLLVQPIISDAPFVLSDVIIVIIMGVIFSIPFVLYVRGVVSRGN